jgi:hypothetical protein
MAQCVNCDLTAVYVNKIAPEPETDSYYCRAHLPKFLYAQRDAGNLNIPVEVPVEELPVDTKASKKKKTTDVVEDTVAEPIVDEVVEPEITPVTDIVE